MVAEIFLILTDQGLVDIEKFTNLADSLILIGRQIW